MRRIIKWLRDKYSKPDLVKCNKIISNLNLDIFSGMIGKEISYIDKVTMLPMITISLLKNDIVFDLSDDKDLFFNNIGLVDLNKKERIWLYKKIEKHMLLKRDEYISSIKRSILSRINLTESEFSFLVSNSRDTEL